MSKQKELLNNIFTGENTTDNFKHWFINNCINKNHFFDIMNNYNKEYIQDLELESANFVEYENKLEEEIKKNECYDKEEYLQLLNNNYKDGIIWFIDNYGYIELLKYIKKNMWLINWEIIKQYNNIKIDIKKANEYLFYKYKKYLFNNIYDIEENQYFIFVYDYSNTLISIGLYTKYSNTLIEKLLTYDDDFQCSVFEDDIELFKKNVKNKDYINSIYSIKENQGGATNIIEYLNKQNINGTFWYSVLESEKKWIKMGYNRSNFAHIFYSK